jgi:hypothetical protein
MHDNNFENIEKEFTDKVLFVVATPLSREEFLNKKPFGLFLKKIGENNINYICKDSNKQGLSKIYNEFITEEYRNKTIIFIHDDVLISDLFFREKILDALKKYDIFGLAGGKTLNLDKRIIPAWHHMTNQRDLVGEVAHYKDEKIWTTVFGPTNDRAVVIDGLFIGINVNKAIDQGLSFDEDFEFHHYDISLCVIANKLKIKTGVFQLFVIHSGLGDSMNTPEWRESAKKFLDKYGK